MGGRPADKKSYLAPFSRYLHIYAQIHDFMHIVNISTSAGPRKFLWSYFNAEWSIYGGSSPGQKVVSRTVKLLFAYFDTCIQKTSETRPKNKRNLFGTPVAFFSILGATGKAPFFGVKVKERERERVENLGKHR